MPVLTDPTGSNRLNATLLESHHRWRAFSALAVDFVFETDGNGRLTFLAPDTVLGWSSPALMTQPAACLLTGHQAGCADPFHTATPMHNQRTWLTGANGASHCFAISSEPMLDGAGRPNGTRGVGVDVTIRERADAQTAAALRRGEVLEQILSQMRQEVLAPLMMETVLTALARALGASGAGVMDLSSGPATGMAYAVGADPAPVLGDAQALLARDDECAAQGLTADGHQLLVCLASTRFGERAGLVAWRAGSSRAWDANDLTLASSVTGLVRIVLEHEAIQRELARQARTDPLTGLLNRRAFLEETARRIDRLDREGLPGTLMFIDLDRLKPLNDRLGHEAGDAALVLTAALLRRTFRPSDLVARLGGDEFAVWLDGSDELTAAERAESLRLAVCRT